LFELAEGWSRSPGELPQAWLAPWQSSCGSAGLSFALSGERVAAKSVGMAGNKSPSEETSNAVDVDQAVDERERPCSPDITNKAPLDRQTRF